MKYRGRKTVIGLLCLLSGIGVLADPQDVRIEQVIPWLEGRLPHVAEELQRIRQDEPEQLPRVLEEWRRNIMEFSELSLRHPEVAEQLYKAERLEHESWQIAGQIAEVQDKFEKQRLTKTLREHLGEIFDARLVERNVEIQQLERELGDLRTLIERRKSMRESIIERRLSMMFAESDEASRW